VIVCQTEPEQQDYLKRWSKGSTGHSFRLGRASPKQSSITGKTALSFNEEVRLKRSTRVCQSGAARETLRDVSSGLIDFMVGLHFQLPARAHHMLDRPRRKGVGMKRPAHLVTAPGSAWWSLNQWW